jgi:hypothetical protein
MSCFKLSFALSLLAPVFLAAQSPPRQSTAPAPPHLPVIDRNACPFEGCTFRNWLVTKDSPLFSTWEKDGKTIGTLKKDQVVTGLTGVHITWEPDRIQVLKPIPELHLQPGDIILRYQYLGEGFANVWVNGEWKESYDLTFVTEMDNSGCLRDCPAKVISEGRKDWWVRVKTPQGTIGWAKADDQFDCMDALGGDNKCESLQSPTPHK